MPIPTRHFSFLSRHCRSCWPQFTSEQWMWRWRYWSEEMFYFHICLHRFHHFIDDECTIVLVRVDRNVAVAICRLRVRSPTTMISSPSTTTLCAAQRCCTHMPTEMRYIYHSLNPISHMLNAGCDAIVWLLKRQTCRRRSTASNRLLRQNVMVFEWHKCEMCIFFLQVNRL